MARYGLPLPLLALSNILANRGLSPSFAYHSRYPSRTNTAGACNRRNTGAPPGLEEALGSARRWAAGVSNARHRLYYLGPLAAAASGAYFRHGSPLQTH